MRNETGHPPQKYVKKKKKSPYGEDNIIKKRKRRRKAREGKGNDRGRRTGRRTPKGLHNNHAGKAGRELQGTKLSIKEKQPPAAETMRKKKEIR